MSFYELTSYGTGVAIDAFYSSEDIIGRVFKVGRARKSTSDEYFIGCDVTTGKLIKAVRNSTDSTFEVMSYISKQENSYATTKAQIDAYGNGHPVFYEPLRKLVVKYGTKYYDAVGTEIDPSELEPSD